MFSLRRRNGTPPGAYRTLGYPVTPVLFLLVAGWLIVNTLQTSPRQSFAGLGLMALGVPFYLYWSRRGSKPRLTDDSARGNG